MSAKKSAKQAPKVPASPPWGLRIAYILQCVTDPEPGKPQNFWTVHRAGEHGWDCVIGEALATAVLERLEAGDFQLTFSNIIRDMIAGGIYSGVEIGFISEIGKELARGRPGRRPHALGGN